MRQSRLIKSLEKLASRDREQFYSFVISPYFNQHQKTIDLLAIIQKELNKERPQLDRIYVFKQLFPNKTYDEQKLHNVMSYLMRLYHRFLAFQQFEQAPFMEQTALLENAYAHTQWEVFKNRSKLFEKTMKQHGQQNDSFHYSQYRYHYLKGNYTINNVSRSDTKAFQQMLDHLDYHYILTKLRHGCQLKAHQMIMNTTYNFRLLEELLAHIEANWEEYKLHPTISAYFIAMQMLENQENASYYQQLKQCLSQSVEFYAHEDLNILYDFASNYCIMQLNHGDRTYEKELFEIYQQSLKSGTVLTNGVMGSWDYKNITTLGCRLQEFEWTKNFIEEYKDALVASQRENAYNYNLAVFYFSKKAFEQALSLLLRVQFTEVQYHLGGNFLLIRTYYILENTEALLSLLETMRIYVMRSKKMTTKEKKGYLNLFRFSKKLVYLRNEQPIIKRTDFEKKITDFQSKLMDTDNIIGKNWLVEEANRLAASKQPQGLN